MATRSISESASAASSTTSAVSVCTRPIVESASAVSATTTADAFCSSLVSIAADLPVLSFSGWSDNNIDIDATLPPLKFSGKFGTPMIMAEAKLPVLVFSGVGGFVMPLGNLPAIGFSGEIKPRRNISVSGKLPILGFAGEFGGQPSYLWRLPVLSFNGLMSGSLVNEGSISGNLPVLSRNDSFLYHDEQDLKFSGNLPPLAFSGEMKRQGGGNLYATLPPLKGDFVMYSPAIDGGRMSGRLPVLSLSGSITGDPYFNVAGYLPVLSLPPSGHIGSITKESATDDITRTGDDIIRHRRS